MRSLLSCARRRWRLTAFRLCSFAVGVLLIFHATSCGFLFCIHLPLSWRLSGNLYDDLRDISVLAGGPRRIERSVYASEGMPKLIPKIIHQTYKSMRVPEAMKPFMASWRLKNQDWEIRFYDDAACLSFVQREFPEYLEAYKALPKDVERSDFFRYMVVLRLGGVYADIDCECLQSFDQLIRPRDTMVVAWENEFSTAEEARRRAYVRKRQVLQWVFAAAPGHPALREMCEHIAQAALSMYGQSNSDTLERTGPGAWTDIVLKHARQHPPAYKDEDPFSVRVLPRILWGVHPRGLDSMPTSHPSMVVMHHFLGSWKIRSPWDLLRWSVQKQLVLQLSHLLQRLLWPVKLPAAQSMEEALPNDVKGPRLYPVSILWEPPFTMLVHLVGHGSLQAGMDVSEQLTRFGAWQPSGSSSGRGPTVVDALIGSLGGHGAPEKVLVDIGAGSGYLALAAASRGHRTIAFELDRVALASLNASLAFNGFHRHVTVHQVALGNQSEPLCLEFGSADYSLAAGYAHPQAHVEAPGGQQCRKQVARQMGQHFLPSSVDVGGLHISAPGWEGWILQGLQELLERPSPPSVIVLELYPQLLEQHGFPQGAVGLLESLWARGYTDISHSGQACDDRWHEITRSILLRGGLVALPGQAPMKQPTWCRLPPDKFGAVTRRIHASHPENILLIHRPPSEAPAHLEDLQLLNASLSNSRLLGADAGTVIAGLWDHQNSQGSGATRRLGRVQ